MGDPVFVFDGDDAVQSTHLPHLKQPAGHEPALTQVSWRPTSSAGQREWTLSGGLFVCGVCGRSMTAMTTSRPNGRRYFYYRCPRRVQDGNGACSQAKYYVAEEVEAGV